MRIQQSVLFLILVGVILSAACQNKQENTSVMPENPHKNQQEVIPIPIIPEGYLVDEKLYLA